MTEDERHFIEYLTLLVGLTMFFGLFIGFRHSKEALKIISGAGTVFYIVWGLAHHAVEGRLNKFIAFEYILFGSVVFLLLFTVLSF
jgi:hypothetical protein